MAGSNISRTGRIGYARILALRHRLYKFLDPYHFALSLTWTQYFALVAAVFVLINLLFGLLYYVSPDSVINARHDVFLDYFFFSIQTLATVGYGVMSPGSLHGHIVASVEILTGMVDVAVTTGVVFARFSRTTARILFSRVAVIRDFEGERVLMLRVANKRHNRIVEASASLSLVRTEGSVQGESFVRIRDLRLIRQRTPLFALSWTLIHTINAESPLYGLNAAQLAASRSRIVASVTGHDKTTAAEVYASKDYEAEDLIFDSRFVDILHAHPGDDEAVDLSRFHDVQYSAPAEQLMRH